MKIAGNLFVGEASAWGAAACRPLSGHPWPMVWSNLTGALVAIGSITAMSTLQAVGLAPSWGWVVALLIAIIGGIWATILTCRRLAVRHFRKALLARDVPNPLSASLEIVEEWIITTTGVVETRAPLKAVSDITKIGPYWVLLIQGSAHFIPIRTFVSRDQEMEFLRALRDGVTEATLHRSSDLANALA